MQILMLLAALCAAIPAHAANFCGAMMMPPADLKQVSRGFSSYHSGVDLMAPYGSPVRAAAGGTVVFAGWYFAYGRIIDIQHADGIITRYAHLSAFAPGLVAGTPVHIGEIIGNVGMTGRAHGPHVHFEVRVNGHPVDPKPYIALAACPAGTAPTPIEEATAPDTDRRKP